MSKIIQIEQALVALDPASFQRLGDAYLRRLGYKNLNAFGLVLGSAKTTLGTPDTFEYRDDGKLTFVEYTTQQNDVGSKLSADLEKCFDEVKTGIPVAKFGEIILCHNARLGPDEEVALHNAGDLHGVLVTVIGPWRIVHDLYHKYPVLADDFLGVSIDTGQLLGPEEFVRAYNSAPLAAPLDTSFRFRESEVGEVLEALRPGAVVLLSGRPGVGKSRLALECCRRYVERHTEARVVCVLNRGADLFHDIKGHFAEPGEYIILVDDANRVTRLDYLLQLLHGEGSDRTVAVLGTVRDYALDRISTVAAPYRPTVVEIDRLSDEQIRTLVSEAFGITNHHYLERIAAIAEGNPRLAVMAAQIAVKENTLGSIANVITLYDEYFRSIRVDIEELGNEGMLKAAAAVAFFRAVDRSNFELMAMVEASFGLSPLAFWAEVHRLHDIEAVDVYEDEVVRISDQVLATYLFYVAVLRTKVIKLSTLFEHFFPAQRGRFVEVLNPVFTAFGSETVDTFIRPQLELAWELIRERPNSDILEFMDLFWFIKPAETLATAAQMIDELPAESVEDEAGLLFKASSEGVPSGSALSILEHFAQAEIDLVKSALHLLCRYFLRRPTDVAKVVRVLEEAYGINDRSYLQGFVLQEVTLDILALEERGSQSAIMPRLLMAYAQSLLLTHFHRFGPSKRLSFSIVKFDVPVTEELISLRAKTWKEVLKYAENQSLFGYVLDFIEGHTRSGYQVANRDLVEGDSRTVLPFFLGQLDPENYRHCATVHEYLDMLDRIGVPYDTQLGDYFRNPTFDLATLLFDDWVERREVGIEESEARRHRRIAAFVAQLIPVQVTLLYDQCRRIRSTLTESHDIWQFDNGVRLVLLAIADRDGGLFMDTLLRFLGEGNAIGLTPYGLVSKLIDNAGAQKAFDFLWSLEGPTTTLWRCSYFVALPDSEVSEALLGRLLQLIEKEPSNEFTSDLDYLLKFQSIDPSVVTTVVRILVERAASEAAPRFLLERLVCSYSKVGQRIAQIFAENVDLLKEAYFLAASERGNHADYDGEVFNVILDLDRQFASQWVAWMFSRKGFLSRHDDHRDYKRLWARGDFMVVMDDLLTAVVQEGRKHYGGSYFEVFFVLRDSAPDKTDLVARQDKFVEAAIIAHATDVDVMEVLFTATSEFDENRRRKLVTTFLSVNQDFEAFQRLPLEPIGMSWTGSAVPIYERRASYLESLVPLCSGVSLLRHRSLLEDRITAIRRQAEAEKKRDFLRE